jgi:phytanoyl-CoA hydroxylase
MLATLGERRIAAYRRDGFAVVEQLLDPEELEEWRGAIDQAVVERSSRVPHIHEDPERIAKLPADKRAGLEFYGAVFTQRIFLHRTSERVRRLVLDARLGRLAADLEGVDRVRVWQDQALIKEPWGQPTAFHIDGPIFAFSDPRCVSVWVALDDATLSNGCLAYLPGTHREQSMRNAGIGKDLGGLFDANPQWASIDPVFCPIPAGGAVFHNGYIAHGAGANMTHGRRRAMTVVYIAEGVVFDREPFQWEGAWAWTKGQHERYRRGDLLNDDEQFPLAFSRA